MEELRVKKENTWSGEAESASRFEAVPPDIPLIITVTHTSPCMLHVRPFKLCIDCFCTNLFRIFEGQKTRLIILAQWQ